MSHWNGSSQTSLVVCLPASSRSMELRHFVWTSDATDLFGFLVVVLYILRASGPFVTVLAFACILVLCPIILRRVMLFLLRADVVGSGAGLSVVDLVYFVCVVGISLSVIRRW